MKWRDLEAEDYPHWSTPEKVVEWVRERRVEATDPGPEDADAPAFHLGGGVLTRNMRDFGLTPVRVETY